MHLIRLFENLAFRIVRPVPLSDLPGQPMLQVILEQGLQQSRFTALFSVLFQGLHGDVTHRRAQSIPTEMSRDVIVRIIGIQDLRQARRCTAWSGRIQFHSTQLAQLDRVYSGIGVCLTVNAFRHRFLAVDDDGYPLQSSASSSQVPLRLSFRQEDPTLYPSRAQLDDAVDDIPSEHVPCRLIPDLRVIWERYLINTMQGPYRFVVETRFCDHDRYPRMDRSRIVTLPPDVWRSTLLQTWSDLIDATAPVSFYLARPHPIGGQGEILVHLILAQHQHRGFASVLVTTLVPDDDPRDPPRLVLKVPSVVDKGLIIQESGMFQFCPPFIPFSVCSVSIGDVPVMQDTLRSTASGDGFLCVVDSAASARVRSVPDQDPNRHVDSLFHMLARAITNLVVSVTSAMTSHSEWTNQCELLLDQSEAEQFSIPSFSACTGSSVRCSSHVPMTLEPPTDGVAMEMH